MSWVAAGVAVVGIGTSLVQGAQAKREQKEAERQATVSLNQAKKQLSVNRLEGVSINTEAYDNALRNITAQQQQALAALSEDPRALAAGVGKLQGASVNMTQELLDKQNQDLVDREMAIAKEDANIDKNLANISLAETEGAQAAAAEASRVAGISGTNVVEGLAGAGQKLYEESDLYKKKNSIVNNVSFKDYGFSKGVPKIGDPLSELPAPNYGSLISGLTPS
jgi:hypothetical protein